MRPRNFDEFVGQEHIVGEGRVLRKRACAKGDLKLFDRAVPLLKKMESVSSLKYSILLRRMSRISRF
jgi:hypothetical protein